MSSGPIALYPVGSGNSTIRRSMLKQVARQMAQPPPEVAQVVGDHTQWKGKAEALREAQRRMLKKCPHPCY